jgi:P4 family phage/plasmid primase-like protien
MVMGALNWNPEITKHNRRLYMRKKSLDTSGPGKFSAPVLAGTDARDGTATTRPLSELGNALRLLDTHQGNIHYIREARAWLRWRDGAWHWDLDGAEVRSLAARLAQQIYDEGGLHLSDSECFVKWSRASQKERTIAATISLLKDFPEVRLPMSLVDANIYLAGFNNARQVVDLKTGEVRPAKQSDLITKSLSVQELGNAAKPERWLAFLDQVFGADAELIDWLKRWCGYMLTGSTAEQFFMFCYGVGANGKSVFAEILRFILGDYARVIAPETLTESKRQAGSASPDIAALKGARMALSSETEDGAALAESLIKSLVSGDSMTARMLHANCFEFTPQFKLMILGNHKPVVRGTDHGIWRRIHLLPFLRIFKPQERDAGLLDKLKAEAPHILAWMIEGCLEWQQRGLADVPGAISRATDEYQSEQDLMGRWFSECCEQSPNGETSARELYQSYKNWCIENGLHPASNVSFGRRLTDRGFKSRKSNGNAIWRGITLNYGLSNYDEVI